MNLTRALVACLALVGPLAASPFAASAAPVLYVQPRDGIRPILEAIAGAERSIRLKIYLFTDSRQDVIDALAAAQRRGVDVRILIEREPAGGSNTGIYLKLRDAGLNARRTQPFRFVFTHEKSLVIDDRAAIISTANVTASSFLGNREYQVALDDPALVAEASRVFDADWEAKDIDLRDARLVWGPSLPGPGGLVRGNARARVLELIRGARSSLVLQQAGLVDEETIRELEAAAARGVKVQVLGSPADPEVDTYFVPGAERLRAAGADVRYVLAPYVHAKVIVADGDRALVGSINLSANSLDANRELSVILTRADAPRALEDLLAVLAEDASRASAVNPYTLPPLEGARPADRMSEFLGRMVTLEGVVTEVERGGAVAFLKFGTGPAAPRGVVFARSYDLFPQPFPEAYLGRRVRLTGRVQLYGEYYEVILDRPDQISVLP